MDTSSQMNYREWFYGSYQTGFKQVAPGEGHGLARLDELYGSFLSYGPKRVLELGAGTGEFVGWLKLRGVSEAWGVDFSKEQVLNARASGRDVREEDLFDALAACENGSLDGIAALDVLEHLTRDQLVQLALELSRVLAPGGVLLVQVPNGSAWRVEPIWLGDLTHETLLCDVSLAQLFAPVGMSLERAWGVTPGFGTPARAVRTILWKMVTVWPRTIDWLESGRSLKIYERNLCAIIRKPCQPE